METPLRFEASCQTATTPSLWLTPSALERLRVLSKKKELDHPLYLQIQVDAGGCAGFTYTLNLVERAPPQDIILTCEDVFLVLDESSLDILKDSVLDFATSLMGEAFTLKNPAATASCGCGTSFSIF